MIQWSLTLETVGYMKSQFSLAVLYLRPHARNIRACYGVEISLVLEGFKLRTIEI